MQTMGPKQLSLAMAGLDLGAIGLAVPGTRGSRSRTGLDGASMLKALVGRARALGFEALQIDGSMAGLRARELDRSARRDMAALLRRSELACSGVDLVIPAEHVLRTANVDRAVSSTLEAIGLAADLGSLARGSVAARASASDVSVSMTLPEKLPADVLSTIESACQARGVRVGDHAFPVRAAADGTPSIGVGIDPAAVLGAGQDPAAVVAGLGGRLVSARLSDISKSLAGVRVAPGSGSGRLDLLGYQVGLHAARYGGKVVMDLRAVGDQARAIESAVRAWGAAASRT